MVEHGLLADTVEGMKYLYDAGVEHRDLKSANCLITHDWRVKDMTVKYFYVGPSRVGPPKAPPAPSLLH